MTVAHGSMLRVRGRIDWLKEALRLYPDIPPLALFRAVEMRAQEGLTLQRPVLDLGSGDGRLSHILFGDACDVGIDLDLREARRARVAGALRSNVVGDARRLPFGSASLGGVLSNSVLEHIDRHEDVLAETARVLRHGGRFLFTVPSHRFNDYLLNPKRLRAAGKPEEAVHYVAESDRLHAHRNYQDEATWRNQLGAVGFRVLETRTYLPEPAMEMWDRLEYLFTRPFYEAIPHRNARLVALWPPRWAGPLWAAFLRKSYLADPAPGTIGGCFLFLAEKA